MFVPGGGVEASVAEVREPQYHADYEAVNVAEKVARRPVLDVVR